MISKFNGGIWGESSSTHDLICTFYSPPPKFELGVKVCWSLSIIYQYEQRNFLNDNQSVSRRKENETLN